MFQNKFQSPKSPSNKNGFKNILIVTVIAVSIFAFVFNYILPKKQRSLSSPKFQNTNSQNITNITTKTNIQVTEQPTPTKNATVPSPRTRAS